MLTADDVHAAAMRLADTLPTTPLIPARQLSERLQRPVWLKLESLQTTGSFKPRGALNWLLSASDAELRPGLGAVSAGNHALGLAWAARRRQVPVTIVMPENASPTKVRNSRALGAEVILHGDINAAWERMHRLVKQQGLTLVHPYDDERIIAGQGTVGLEILAQAPQADTVICPIGGGGLISGIGLALKASRPGAALIGVEPQGAASMAHAWSLGGPRRLPSVRSWAKSLAAAEVGQHSYSYCRATTDQLLQIGDAALQNAVAGLLMDDHIVAEPGGVAGVALLRQMDPGEIPGSGDIVVVVTGGNADPEELATSLAHGAEA
ncbi:threonine/serine dehydratase [Methylonatrum kenyense]|uniref:threonine ammonia-lyase n=1 Tax=Methylonatrum kenyense TaxID=455253 RepID=UPI0020C14833|nr:threonine/serine dehydratase [Methylonatrum kenyense]MCK8515648.1 threonine/serine dehydratase [Methylonatrum kenyense]